MKKAIVLAAALVALTAVSSFADEYVRGYQKSNGTYVQPYQRTEPDSRRDNNYSSQGNTNPYTGERGSQRNENSNPPAYNKSYGNGQYGR